MPVGAVTADSTSPSPTKVPPVIFTVALASVRLSGSDTVTFGDSTTALPFSVNDALVVPVRVGGSFTAVTLTVVGLAVLRLNEPLPSLSTHVTRRGGVGPATVGV